MQLDATLTLANLNIRREKAGDDEGPIAVDLKFTGDVKPEEIKGLFTTEAQFRRLLGDRWDVDNDLTVTDSLRIPLEVEGVGCTFELKTELSEKPELRWTEANVDSITLETKPGRVVGIKLRVQVHPTKEQVAQLTDWHSMDLDVSVWSRQHDLNLERAPAPAKAAEEADETFGAGDQDIFTPADDADVIVPGQKPPQRPKRRAAVAH